MDRFTIELHQDYDWRLPTDFECYSGEDVEAFRAGDWWYVGVIVRYEAGETSTVAVSSWGIWGVEWGRPEYVAHVLDLAASEFDEMRREFLWLPAHDFTADEIKEV